MKRARNIVALTAALFLALPAWAGGGIEVVEPWARPTIPNRPGAVYFGIRNDGEAADQLVGARAEGVGSVELHRSEEKDGVMTMAPVDAVEVPAGGMAHLGPGGFHLMLFDIGTPLKVGDSLALTLEFEQAGEIAVTVPVMRGQPDHGGQEGGGAAGSHGQGMSGN